MVLMAHVQDERRPQMEVIAERGQERPADWPKRLPPVKFGESDIVTAKSEWEWRKLATVYDLMPTDDAITWVLTHSSVALFDIKTSTFSGLLLSSMATHNWLYFTSPDGATLPRNRYSPFRTLSEHISKLILQMCPHKRAFVLDHGIVGDDLDGNLYVSCKCHVLSTFY